MSAADLSIPLRDALIGNADITSRLSAYKGSWPVFTQRPAPVDAPRPLIMVSPDIAIREVDGIDDFRPIQTRDITVYGLNVTGPADYIKVEELGYIIRKQFHSQRQSITPLDGWHVVDINCMGPIPAPTDDDKMIARMVSLDVSLARLT